MSKPPRARVLEFRKHHIDALGMWIEVAVFADEDLLEMMRSIDLTDLELDEYKTRLVSDWPGIPSEARSRLTPEAIGEIYDLIVTLNPMLHPKNVVQIERIALDTYEYTLVMQWFATGGKEGNRPEVVHGNA